MIEERLDDLEERVRNAPKGQIQPFLDELRLIYDTALAGSIPVSGFPDDAGPVPDHSGAYRPPNYDLSPTIDRFVYCDADVAVLYGARGEGKTTGAISRIIRLSYESPEAWPVRWPVVRDTWVNLKRTTIPTLEEGHRRGWWHAEFSEGGMECVLNHGVAKLFLWGMDHDRDASKFQSFEAGGLWLEEPAAAADMTSGIPASVLALGQSSLRQPGVRRYSAQITMNPPDSDHWTMEFVDTVEETGSGEIAVEVFQIPSGENRHLPQGYRERMRSLLEAAGRQDLVRRLVEGQVGSVQVGVAVTPEFSDVHVSKTPIEIRYAFPTFRFWDFGLNPTCIWAQVTPSGCLNILGCRVGMNIGLEELIQQHVIPWEAKYGFYREALRARAGRPSADAYDEQTVTSRSVDGRLPTTTFQTRRAPMRPRYVRFRQPIRDIGDPAGFARDQSSSERSARRSLENLLSTHLEKGPVEWAGRRDSLKAVLTRMIGGRPMVQIDPQDAHPLVHALRGAWRYAKYPSGRVSPEPIKDINSHPGDALGYGTGVLWPVHELTQRATAQVPPTGRQAETYMGR